MAVKALTICLMSSCRRSKLHMTTALRTLHDLWMRNRALSGMSACALSIFILLCMLAIQEAYHIWCPEGNCCQPYWWILSVWHSCWVLCSHQVGQPSLWSWCEASQITVAYVRLSQRLTVRGLGSSMLNTLNLDMIVPNYWLLGRLRWWGNLSEVNDTKTSGNTEKA